MDIEIQEKKRTTPKRLLIDIPINLHTEIKSRAALRNISIRTWVVRALIQAIKQEDKYE